MHKRLIIINLIVLLSYSFTAIAQKQLNSPYSRFNIGAIESQGSFKSRGMGGIGTAMRDNNSIFLMNPASYSSLDTNSFSFDFGFDFGISQLREWDNKYSSNDINFNHLYMGFPIKKGWGIATGIAPVTYGFYNISDEVQEGDSNYDPLTGPYSEYHSGKGGLSNFFLGTGVNITKNFSAGINMTIMFGIIHFSLKILTTIITIAHLRNSGFTELILIMGSSIWPISVKIISSMPVFHLQEVKPTNRIMITWS